VITARNTDIGALITAGTTRHQRSCFTWRAVNQLRVYVSVPEVYEADIRDGDKTTLTLDALWLDEATRMCRTEWLPETTNRNGTSAIRRAWERMLRKFPEKENHG
jgi:hypothetical protein